MGQGNDVHQTANVVVGVTGLTEVWGVAGVVGYV